MVLQLGLLIFSLIISGVLFVPFINLLYKINFRRRTQQTLDPFGKPTPIFDKFNAHKVGTPVGGGILVVVVVAILFWLIFPLLQFFGIPVTTNYTNLHLEIGILFFTFLSFGLLGFYDDLKKFFGWEKSKFFGLRMPAKLAIQILLATIISLMMYFGLGIHILNVPFVAVLDLGWLYIPFAIFVIVAFSNAVNITDGLDGLAAGNLIFALIGLWILSVSILDLPSSIFSGLWIGALLAFLYFNVYPARIFMGDVGALSFGATFAVLGLLLGKPFALVILGGIFVIEIAGVFLQLLSKKFLHRKLFSVTPLHLYFQRKGWPEAKVAMRFWLMQIILTIFGLWITLI
jgi:phospho-N-acetylmuramoyl-pentapeptide-transferase